MANGGAVRRSSRLSAPLRWLGAPFRRRTPLPEVALPDPPDLLREFQAAQAHQPVQLASLPLLNGSPLDDLGDAALPYGGSAELVDPMERARAALQDARRQMPGLMGLDADTDFTSEQAAVVPTPETGVHFELVAAVAELRRERAELADEVADLRAAVQDLRGEVAKLSGALAAPQAPVALPAAPGGDAESEHADSAFAPPPATEVAMPAPTPAEALATEGAMPAQMEPPAALPVGTNGKANVVTNSPSLAENVRLLADLQERLARVLWPPDLHQAPQLVGQIDEHGTLANRQPEFLHVAPEIHHAQPDTALPVRPSRPPAAHAAAGQNVPGAAEPSDGRADAQPAAANRAVAEPSAARTAAVQPGAPEQATLEVENVGAIVRLAALERCLRACEAVRFVTLSSFRGGTASFALTLRQGAPIEAVLDCFGGSGVALQSYRLAGDPAVLHVSLAAATAGAGAG